MNESRTDISPHCYLSSGFTLIELSIVLVIIGLIVGGILVGQDLIKAAEIRATISQLEKYNTAVNTFRTKYNGIPGDITASSASSFGLAATSGGGVGLGDGNGVIQDPNGTNTPVGEIVMFWRQISDAGLVNGSYGKDLTVSTGQAPSTIVPANDFPAAKTGRTAYVIVGSDLGVNYFGILGLIYGATGGPAGTAYYYGMRNPSLSGIEAYNIDKKIDDGMPLVGAVQVRGWGNGDILAFLDDATNAPYWTATPSAPACVTNGPWPMAPNPEKLYYNQSIGNGGDIANCELRVRFN